MRKRAQRAAAALNKPLLSEEERAANRNRNKRERRAEYNALIAAGIPKMPGTPKTPSKKGIQAMVLSTPVEKISETLKGIVELSKSNNQSSAAKAQTRCKRDEKFFSTRTTNAWNMRKLSMKRMPLVRKENSRHTKISPTACPKGVNADDETNTPKKRKAVVVTAGKRKVFKPALW